VSTPKTLVVYESKYGNTKRVAESIVEGMKTVPGIEVTLKELKEVDLKQVTSFDAIVIGSPNHIGSATGGVRRFISQLGKLKLAGKRAAVFDTYLAKDFEKAMKKMEKQISEKVLGLKLVTPGLSIQVEGMKGPITEGEFPKCKDFGIKIATLVKSEKS
jgi:menaquinone-dependent protoporphyrinogen IX oxidase